MEECGANIRGAKKMQFLTSKSPRLTLHKGEDFKGLKINLLYYFKQVFIL